LLQPKEALFSVDEGTTTAQEAVKRVAIGSFSSLLKSIISIPENKN
jgi:hypothetical protein